MKRRGNCGLRMRKMRRISGSFWTPERDERLRCLEAEGFSAAKIAEKLGTTRGAVLGRLHRLSGAALTYPSYIRQEKEARTERERLGQCLKFETATVLLANAPSATATAQAVDLAVPRI